MGQASKQSKVPVTPMVAVEISYFTAAKLTAWLHFPAETLSQIFPVILMTFFSVDVQPGCRRSAASLASSTRRVSDCPAGFSLSRLSQQNSCLSSELVLPLKVAALGGGFLVHGFWDREGEINHEVNKAWGIELHSQSTSIKRTA